MELNEMPTSLLSKYQYQGDTGFIEEMSKTKKARKIKVNVKCVYPDTDNPGGLITKTGSVSIECNKPVSQIGKEFLATFPDIPDQTYYIGYDQLLFREGTITECGITHGKLVELIAPGKNAAAYHNQGLSLIIWSIVPFLFGLAALIFSMTSNAAIESEYQALFLFLGLTFLIPSFITAIIGMILIPECPMPCYFNGSEWC